MAIGQRQPTFHMTWQEDELVLSLAPLQGRWTAEQYLLLTDQTKRLIEFTDGFVEILRRQERYWLGADLVVEIVSPDNPERDTREKRADYAEAGILEYWIVDPQEERITVLRLDGDQYTEHGVFHRGESATSALLQGFAVSVDAVLDAS